MEPRTILCVVGTRPEAIKMAPVILALEQTNWAEPRVLVTGQHKELLQSVLGVFGIQAHIDLSIMQPGQSLAELTSRLTIKLDASFREISPDAILAQGDTTTVFTSALAAFYQRIPFGHIEAGLRTGDKLNPFPEEMNRVLAGHLARWHFAPTASARQNLLDEGISSDAITVSGNTVIDALLSIEAPHQTEELPPRTARRQVLVTAHRRENFGEPMANIFRAIRELADQRDDVEFIYPLHPNPNVKDMADRMLGQHRQIKLVPPMSYVEFVHAMRNCFFIMSDSGGVQEEGPALAKPVLVLRNETERPEAVQAGVVALAGTDTQTIVRMANELLDDPTAYAKMSVGVSPYGDGHAASRIVRVLENDLVNLPSQKNRTKKPS